MSIKTIKEHFHVITGGPGVGKTTLIKSLHDCGFRIVDEDARRIIKNEMQAKGEGLPWKSKQRYAALMLQASIESFLAVVVSGESNPTFFDRGLLDAICYMRMEQMPISEEVIELTKKYVYDTDVFMLPPWKEIYETDAERKQNWGEAEHTFEMMKATYLEFGYNIIIVPKSNTTERVKFILQHIQDKRLK